MATRATRSNEKKRKIDEGILEEPKEKIMTLGKYLALERQAEEEKLLESVELNQYDALENYSKEQVLADLKATEVNPSIYFDHDYYEIKDITGRNSEKSTKILFLTLKTGEHPKDFTHFCNSSSMKWNLKHYHISSFGPALSNMCMVFVRGEHTAGTSLTSDVFKYLGLVGVQSTSSGSNGKGVHELIEVTLVFDYVINRKDMVFGNDVMKCKKNRYGCSLCH
jgi:hypothetical protein